MRRRWEICALREPQGHKRDGTGHRSLPQPRWHPKMLTHKSASPSRPSPWITGGLSASAPCEGQTPRPWHLLHHTQRVETLWGIALSLWKERKSQLIVSVSFALEKEDQAYFRFSMIMENLIFDLKISYEKKSVFTLSWLWVMSENLPWSLVRSGSGASF